MVADVACCRPFMLLPDPFHLRVLQTYTYTIRPLRDNNAQQQLLGSSTDQHLPDGQTAADDAVGATATRDGQSHGSGGSSNVHSYEVGFRVVVEGVARV